MSKKNDKGYSNDYQVRKNAFNKKIDQLYQFFGFSFHYLTMFNPHYALELRYESGKPTEIKHFSKVAY